MKKWAAKAAFLALIALFGFSFATRQVFAATTVSPSNMNGWAFQTVGATASGSFVSGPATTPLGTGSARLFTATDGSQTVALHTSAFLNSKLADVTNLQYSAYASTSNGGSVGQPFMYVHVSTGLGSDILTFNPNDQSSQTPTVNAWQTWNVKDGFVRSTSFAGFAGGTISQYLAFIANFDSSDVLIVNKSDSTGGLRFLMGDASSSNLFDGNVDNFTIGISGADTTYDFDPDAAPTPTPSPTPTNNYQQQFYTGDLGSPIDSPTVLNKTNSMIFNWGLGSPAAGVPVDNFSARWEGTFDFENASYRFATTADNIARIYLDGNLVLNQTSRGTGQGLATVTAGVHTVRIEYVHGTGASFIWANFWKANVCYDMNADNRINSTDMLVVSKHFNQIPTVVTPWDLNGDTKVNSLDQLMLAQKFNKTCPFI